MSVVLHAMLFAAIIVAGVVAFALLFVGLDWLLHSDRKQR